MFVGIAENVGDALTFWIWTEDTEKLIARSVIRSAKDPTTPNKCVDEVSGSPPQSPNMLLVPRICYLMPPYQLWTLTN